MSATPEPVVIVGAGIVGAAAAFVLSRAGWPVRLLDAGPPGGGVTAGAFGWLGAGHAETVAGRALRVEALRHWHRPPFRDLVDWHGAWTGFPAPGARPARLPAGLRPRGPAWLHPRDGSIDARAAAQTLVQRAGIRAERARVTGVRKGCVITTGGDIAAGTIVIAAGLGSRALLPELPVTASAAVLADFGRVPGPRFSGIVETGGAELRWTRAGHLLSAADAGESAHRLGTRVSGLIGRRVPRPSLICHPRPMTSESAPAVSEPRPGVFTAVAHPGVVLAPLMAAMLARAVGPACA